MKRIVVGVAALMGLAAVTACQPPPPPLPPTYQPPVIDSVVVSPQPAAPGDTVTITVVVADDEVITRADLGEITVPSGVTLPPLPKICTSVFDQGEDRTRAVVTVTCQVPEFASNGTWSIEFGVIDGWLAGSNYYNPGLRTTLQFEVAGGNEDSSPPQMTGYRTDPAVLHQDTEFTLTMRMVDESPPLLLHNGSYGTAAWFYKPFAPNSTVSCRNAAYTPVSATETDVAWSCRATPGVTEIGPHRGYVTARDALGHSTTLELWVEIS